MRTQTDDDDGASFVLLTTCSDNAEASLLQALLEANGIKSVVQGENHRAMLGVLGGYIELRLLVSKRDEPTARELLKSAPEGQTLPETAGAFEDFHGTRQRRRRRLSLTVLLFMFVLPLLASLLFWLAKLLR